MVSESHLKDNNWTEVGNIENATEIALKLHSFWKSHSFPLDTNMGKKLHNIAMKNNSECIITINVIHKSWVYGQPKLLDGFIHRKVT